MRTPGACLRVSGNCRGTEVLPPGDGRSCAPVFGVSVGHSASLGVSYFGLGSGGHSGRTSMGFAPLCTVGAAEFEPPASGRTALFSIAMEFAPVVAEGEVVQLVSCFWLGGAVDCAAAGPTINDARKTTATHHVHSR